MRASQYMYNPQNLVQMVRRTDYPAGTTLYYPGGVATHTSGLAMWNYRNVSIDFYMIGGAATTMTLTVEACNTVDNPTVPLVATDWRDITLSAYDAVTNTNNNASYATAAAGTLVGILHLDDANYRYVRIKIVSSAGANSTLYLATRQVPL